METTPTEPKTQVIMETDPTESKAPEVIGNRTLIFEKRPEAGDAICCRFEGCIIGGIGDTEDEAFMHFVRYINRCALAADMVVDAAAAKNGNKAFPDYAVNRYCRIIDLSYASKKPVCPTNTSDPSAS